VPAKVEEPVDRAVLECRRCEGKHARYGQVLVAAADVVLVLAVRVVTTSLDKLLYAR
jgi:hypothetical protein